MSTYHQSTLSALQGRACVVLCVSRVGGVVYIHYGAGGGPGNEAREGTRLSHIDRARGFAKS